MCSNFDISELYGKHTVMVPLSNKCLLVYYLQDTNKTLSPIKCATIDVSDIKFELLWCIRDKCLQSFDKSDTLKRNAQIKYLYEEMRDLSIDHTQCTGNLVALKKLIGEFIRLWNIDFKKLKSKHNHNLGFLP